MQQIASFIMSRKFLPVLLVLTGAGLFLAFQTQGKNERDDNPKARYARVLRNVGLLLEEGHYNPRKIDDDFSRTVFKKFLEELDGEKNILLQSDIEGFKKYETKIDDEIHGGMPESFTTINEVYMKRLKEAAELYKTMLAKPFDFNKDETVNLNPEKLDFPKNEADRNERWRKQLKYLTLVKFVELQDEREKNKDKKDSLGAKPKLKADSTLEREARESTYKQIERYLTTKKSRETSDENFSTFVNTITGTMDPHTNYFPPIDLRSFNEGMRGSFYGIGAQLKEDDGKIKISSLVSGGPAWKAGELKPDDEILKIAQGAGEPVDVTGYAVTDAVKLIRGADKGSEVRLTIKKVDGTIKVISIIRDEIKLDDTFAKSAVINGQNKIGYIYLPEFYFPVDNPAGQKCSDDVAKEITKLKAENVQGIIIDLRGNGGGSLSEVVKMAGLFIEDGPICQVKGRDEKAMVLRDRDKNILYTGPLAVMVDEGSASASEIFAAAIQDYKRGLIVGSTSTYGKGTVQRNIPLNPEAQNSLFADKKTEDLGTVKLTLQKFYRVNGGATQLKGVTPDIVIPDRYEHYKFREKDNTSSLSWDEIAKADYKPWTSTVSYDGVIKTYTDQISKSTIFNKIREDVDKLDKLNDKEYSINITRYRQEQKDLKATAKSLDEQFKLTTALDVVNISSDTLVFKTATDKADKNKSFLKRLSNDIYIDETVKLVNTIISQSNLAKNN